MMSAVATIDASDPSKFMEERGIGGHEMIHLENDWETSMTQQNNQSKPPEKGCRQIIFKKMKLLLSCEPVDNETKAEIFVHEEPCIFCRMLSSRAKENLIRRNSNDVKPQPSRRRGRGRRRTNGEISGSGMKNSCTYTMLSKNDVMVEQIITPYLLPLERMVLFDVPEFCDAFQLKDHFCRKHGNEYKPDDKIWKVPPRRRVKKKVEKGRNRSDYIQLGKILEKILRDGKDPDLFRNKLEFRTVPFPAHMSVDKSVNTPETPLIEDPDYGKYFRRIKKCIQCEKEADARQKAKKGMLKCVFCNKFHHFSKEKKCRECNQFLSCNRCPGSEMNPHTCGQCQSEFCSSCRKVVLCGSCGRSSCEKCTKTAGLTFENCSHCNYSYCSDCGYTYSCEVCGERFCYYCRDGGYLDCEGKKILCCAECKPQKQCDICGERKSIECYDTEGKMKCSLCGGISCKTCDGVYKCEVCNQSFCYSCRDQKSSSKCSDCKTKVCCSNCGGQYSCSFCGKAQCRACSKSKERCDICRKFCCNKCGVVECCVHCGTQFCKECKPLEEKICVDCGGHLCDHCMTNAESVGFGKCQGCGDDYCGVCRTTDKCDTCKLRFCSKCTTKCKKSGLVNCKMCMAKLDEFYNKIWFS